MRFRTQIDRGMIVLKDRQLEKLNGQMVEIIVMPYDSPGYWQHKYYRGYLLPAIALALGETDSSRVHLYLKAKYLLETVKTLDEIPKNQLRRGIYACELDKIINLQIELATYVTGAILVSDRGGNLCGYIPSLALITPERMNNFLYACEKNLTEIGGSLNVEAMEVRNKWIGQQE